MNLYEQQSTYNPNMPLRGLMYFAQLYQMWLSKRGLDLFGTVQVKIPKPKFIIFYNGNKKFPDITKLKLSDAFENSNESISTDFEWTTTMLNITPGHNESLHKSCKALYDYSSYVDNIKTNLKTMNRHDAIETAVKFAIKKDLLSGFFKNQRMEVLNMSLTEFDQEEYDRNRRREGREEGIAIGAHDKAIEGATNLLKMKLGTIEQIAQAQGLPIEEVEKLKEELEI